ncbi:seminal metalloprotease 1-like [Helicoverpa zea]|uniref:seminal metalloprotease 1-like n=1 Tax=Helicoverpa zea TaxID=7113 RepID=UPI001F58517B|nr:seminal metalloprotease 1-like [Helicoverpa zea]
MLRLLLFFVAVGLVAASPAVVRTRKDIEDFRQFLEGIRKGNGNREQFLARKKALPNVNDEELSGKYQGDIVLDEQDYEVMLQEYAVGRAAYSSSSITSWPDNTVIFEFADGWFDDAQKAAIWDAARDIEAHTCVKFRYKTASDTVYAKITGEPSGCYANVGYRPSRGAHQMNLARESVGVGCFRHATIVHEFMHILGFLHMHTTYNRNDYVQINEQNITPGSEHNFDLYGQSRVDNLGVDYDYVSCMHYGAYSFTANGAPTIVPRERSVMNDMGQRQYITDKDWLRINRYYNCPGAWD